MLCYAFGLSGCKIKIMREIKFRAWDESQNYMAYQGTPDLESIQSFMHHFGNKTLMQFTGHKDCEGKEIYDGDILGDWNDCDGKMVLSNEVVYFDETLGCWMLDQSLHKDHSFATSLFENLNDFTYKVIGNIYENPDLVVVASEADA